MYCYIPTESVLLYNGYAGHTFASSLPFRDRQELCFYLVKNIRGVIHAKTKYGLPHSARGIQPHYVAMPTRRPIIEWNATCLFGQVGLHNGLVRRQSAISLFLHIPFGYA